MVGLRLTLVLAFSKTGKPETLLHIGLDITAGEEKRDPRQPQRHQQHATRDMVNAHKRPQPNTGAVQEPPTPGRDRFSRTRTGKRALTIPIEHVDL